MITKDEIDLIIRAYFNLCDGDATGASDHHRIVVDIMNKYPEYANFFLTSEEREVEEDSE